MRAMVALQVGEVYDRDALIRKFIAMQYNRNDVDFSRGNFRVRGDTIEIIPIYEEYAIRIELFGDEIEALYMLHPLTGDVVQRLESVPIFPASHYVAGTETVQRAIGTIEARARRAAEGAGVAEQAPRGAAASHAHLASTSRCCSSSGSARASRTTRGISTAAQPGEPPHTLLDFFPDDFLMVIDESHVTVPQIGAMYEGDASRKRTLVEHGFRLPSALDNRPLRWDEFKNRVGQTVYLSATPGRYEMGIADGIVEQIIRPTGLIDPQIIVKPSKGQIDDLLEEIRIRAARDERVLVTTLTKKMAEELTDFLGEHGVRVRYLHSDVDTLRRVELLSELRAGVYDVLVGINLLREGLDLPEVSLVSILDADKEGFLRSGTSLIQTIGRAARNVSGEVHMYADTVTDSMRNAIYETDRRREKQVAYNLENGIDPQPLRKRIADITEVLAREASDTDAMLSRKSSAKLKSGKGKAPTPQLRRTGIAAEGADQLEATIADLSNQMLAAAGELKFELAARLRDEVQDMKKELRAMERAATPDAHATSVSCVAQLRRSDRTADWCPARSVTVLRAVHERLRPRPVERVLRHRPAAQRTRALGTLRRRQRGSGLVGPDRGRARESDELRVQPRVPAAGSRALDRGGEAGCRHPSPC